ncbi:MAG: BMP family ABC transporter substrate-binding protein [Spirobacillus cienkowskii]|uniref:BMP family ABC transporter substrate-binding protein n=1 Tax=Spirobacillus cienkowskii TaxID=495820 RepID=A0A369KY16_9BACT|nr:MAG: BMP family ABC transporter substrate-binding protein [Spirobacillus cienkowskii]
MKRYIVLVFILFFSVSAHAVQKVCMILDRGGKDDKSFNQSAVEGFVQALETLNISKESKFLETKSDEQIPQFLRAFSLDPSCGLIITVGFNPSSYVKNFAEKFANKKYLAIDQEVLSKNNNVRSALFREDQGAFLMGSIAAMKSKTKSVGIIGGMDVPMMKRFALAYEAGAKYVAPKIQVYSGVVGTAPTAWNNPTKAKEIALLQYENGVDVIFQVAGPSGQGIFDAAKQLNMSKKSEKKHYAIGVDSNQNELAPGIVITSMVKHVNIAVYTAIKDFVDDKFSAEVKHLDLRNGGIDWAFDKYNRSIISQFEIKKINRIRAEIIDGKIKVPDYYETVKKQKQKI